MQQNFHVLSVIQDLKIESNYDEEEWAGINSVISAIHFIVNELILLGY